MSIKSTKSIDNRKARYNYEIIEKIEAGVVLKGPEIRSIRFGKVIIDNSYATIKKNELWILNLYIDLKNSEKKIIQIENNRPKKLLLKRNEIEKIKLKIKNNGFTLIPLKLHYNKKGFLKVDLGISRGRKKQDLREYKKQQDWKKEKSKLAKRI